MTTYHSDQFHLPVSISDLPGHNFSVNPNTPTEKVVSELENQPSLPGVMIIEDGQLLGIITRLKLFERLGHRFGVELFLQKPIIQLKDLIRTHAQVIPGYSRIDEAIQYALSRPAPDIYDPIVVQRSNGIMQLVDINSLLLAQSHAMASLSNVVGNLEQIDRLIDSGRDITEVFNKILQLLRQVVPYHQAGILVQTGLEMSFVAHAGYRLAPGKAAGILDSATYALIVTHKQAIYIPNAHKVPGWTGMESLGRPHAWLGVPLLSNGQSLGLLSISRNVERAFSPEERETGVAFAQRVTDLICRERHDKTLVDQWSGALGANLQPVNESAPGQVYGKPFSLKAALVTG